MKTIIKVIVILGIILTIVFVFLTCSGGSCIQKIDKTLPSTEKAQWEVKTATHLYYAQSAKEIKTGVTMTGWYENVKGKWIYHKDTIELPYDLYGKNITVKRR